MSEQTPNLPQAKAYHLKDLPGWFHKTLPVPAGRLGIAIYPDGRVRTFPSGNPPLISGWERLAGKSAGLVCGYLPTDPLTLRLRLEYLLSGDGLLLDSQLVCAAEIGDPARFFREVVLPRGELLALVLELDPQLVQESLAGFTPQYAASDLTSGRLDARLLERASGALTASLETHGLRLQAIHLLSLSRSDQRAAIAEKAQALRERLQDVELQKKMAEIETQAQLDDFMAQFAPEMAGAGHVGVGGAGPQTSPAGKPNLGASLRAWSLGLAGPAGKTRAWLGGLFQRKQAAETAAKKPRQEGRWWLGRAVWIGFVVGSGLGLTQLVRWLAGEGWDGITEMMIIIWGSVIPLVLESVRALYEKRESLAEANWTQRGYQHLDNLTGSDRQWADQVVREQCASELRHIQEIVSAVRTREYQRGNQALALELKQTLQRTLDEWLEKVQRADYATPPYVTDLRITQRAWESMLDKDEDLLLYINALSAKADQLQQTSHAGGLTVEQAHAFQSEISQFGNRFFERGRALQAPK